MRPRLFHAASILFAAAGVLCAPASALAYCRTHTCEFDGTEVCDTDPETGCSMGGELAHWRSGCITYAVQLDGSREENISPDALQGLLEDGFRAWSDVDCAGSPGTPPLSASYRGETSCDEVEYNCGAQEDNANIVMFRDSNSELSAFTIALSTIIANLNTGEILDVDVELNSQRFEFYVDEADARADAHDLRLVVNHELGHFLGLSHSRVSGALMRSEYEGSSLLPAADDIAGMCSIFPASASDPACSAESVLDQCLGADSRCPVPVQAKSRGCALGSVNQSAVAQSAVAQSAVAQSAVDQRRMPFGVWMLGGALGAIALRRVRRRPRRGRAVNRSWQR
jgi:hypothetical protein